MPKTFDQAWDLLIAKEAAVREAKSCQNAVTRGRWLREAKRAEITAFPGAQRAAAETKSKVIEATRKWFQAQGTFNANISHCISHLIANGVGVRKNLKSGRSHQLSESQMRQIIVGHFKLKGKPGRPKR